jgi:dTDP-4-dehydrorhamnose reductase
MKRILVTGSNGLLGQALALILKSQYELLLTGIEGKSAIRNLDSSYHSLDITSMAAIKEIIKEFVPDIIINTASYTQVDQCESRKEQCWQINVKGVENLASLARRYDIHLIHYSTDYIFDGKKGPYGEDDKPNPLSYYGKSKLASENVLMQISCPYTIVRTCVIYGSDPEVKQNFFLWLLNNLRKNKNISIVNDQLNNPTLAEDLARGTQLICDDQKQGIFHLAGADYLSRFDFAMAMADFFQLNKELITPIDSQQLGQAANRPRFGGLKIEKARDQLGYQPTPLFSTFEYLKGKMSDDES